MDLAQLARKYIWWQPSEVSYIEARRVIAVKSKTLSDAG
jgi:hypothetical protein